jgi:hypothetical protein
MQPPEREPCANDADFQALHSEFNKLAENVSELEITSSEQIFRNCNEIENLSQEIKELRQELKESKELIEKIQKHQSAVVRRNTKNIAFLRNFGIGVLTFASFSSALSWSAGEFEWHGDRLQAIIIALGGCGGLAFLGFRKIEEKNKQKKRDP